MYAVIESGGKQHRVEPGEVLRLEKLDASEGETVNFDKVMMIGEGENIQIGTPLRFVLETVLDADGRFDDDGDDAQEARGQLIPNDPGLGHDPW